MDVPYAPPGPSPSRHKHRNQSKGRSRVSYADSIPDAVLNTRRDSTIPRRCDVALRAEALPEPTMHSLTAPAILTPCMLTCLKNALYIHGIRENKVLVGHTIHHRDCPVFEWYLRVHAVPVHVE